MERAVTSPTYPETRTVRESDAQRVQQAADRVVREVETVIDGKRAEIETALTVVLAEGHLLIEDVPGVGKTMLARTLAKSLDCVVSRIQFTPDLLPSDVTGVSIWQQSTGGFQFTRGPVFGNVVIGDEINRASPKTQSALLEAMAERQVTVDGVSHRLPDPFVVIATQNPVEMEGTYALPEAQRDRFMARVSMGYPDPRSEIEMLRQRGTGSPLDHVRPVVSSSELLSLVDEVRHVHVSAPVEEYVVAIVGATRRARDLRLGASPRATLHLVQAAKARAAMRGRAFVLPDDVQALAAPVLAHRLLPASRSTAPVADVVQRVLRDTPVPVGAGR